MKKYLSIQMIILLLTISFAGCLEPSAPTKDLTEGFGNNLYDAVNAKYTPSGDRIVYSSKQDGGQYFDIWIMSYDGTNPEQLTIDDYDQIQPSMSHNENFITLSGYNENFDVYNLWELDVRFRLLTQLTNDLFNQTFPSYTGDDEYIIYSSNEGIPEFSHKDGLEVLR